MAPPCSLKHPPLVGGRSDVSLSDLFIKMSSHIFSIEFSYVWRVTCDVESPLCTGESFNNAFPQINHEGNQTWIIWLSLTSKISKTLSHSPLSKKDGT